MDTGDQQPRQPGGDHRPTGVGLETATRHERESRPSRVLVPALVVVLVAALDLTVIAPILPSILFDLRINTAEADRYVWIVSGYLLAYTLTIPLMGRLSDIAGRRETFLIALAIFLLGSAWCAAVDSLPAIIAARAIQGFGGGAMVPVSMALVGDILPPARRAWALGIVAAVDTLGWVLGPIWGAAIERLTGDWRWVFILNIPIGLVTAVALVLFWRGLPVRRHPRQRLDIPGAILLSIALVCLNLGLSVGSEAGASTEPRALGASANPLSEYRTPLLAAGIIALVALAVVERRARSPLIPLSIFGSRLFSASNTVNFLVGAALMVTMVNVPLLVALQVDQTRISTVSAELLSAFSLTMGAGAVLGGRLAERFSYHPGTWTGLVIAALGFWRMTGWGNTIDLARMMPDLALTGAGFGLVVAPIGAAAINAARRTDLGIASGLVIVMRLLGMTLGLSAITAWAVGRLNDAMARIPPVVQQPGESLAAYIARQQEAAVQQAIPATIAVIRDTFGAAAVLCVLALIPAALLYTRAGHGREPS